MAITQLFNLTAISLWHDEAFSALLIRYNFGEMIYRIGLDVHPPLYYILLKGWTLLFNDSVFFLRLFSSLFSVLAIIVFYWLAKEIFKSRKFAVFSAVILALNSFQMQFAMEARMFSLGIFLVLLSTFLFLKALNSQNKLWWLFYAISASAGIYTHYYIFFSLLAQAIFWLYSMIISKKNLQPGLIAYFLIALSYAPWFKILLNQFSQVQENYWIPAMKWGSIPSTFFKMTTGGELDSSKFWYILAVLMIAIIAAVWHTLKKTGGNAKWLIFLLLIIPFAGAGALSIKTSIYLDRYFIFALPFYLILAGGAIFSLENKYIKNALIGAAILGSLVSFPMRWLNLNVAEKPGMAAAAAYLNQTAEPQDKIYIGSSFVYFTFKYYNRTGIHPLLYTPFNLPHFSGTALLSPEDTIEDFKQGIKKNDTVFLINTTGFGGYQPEVPAHWTKQEERGFQDVYDYRGWILIQKYTVN